MSQTNPSQSDERLFSDIYLCSLPLAQGFYVLRQGVPEGRSIEGYASFKQAKSWRWHVEVIPGVNVVGLVTREQLCKVVW